MIDAIVEQYEKYGWILKRILLSKSEYAAAAGRLESQYPEAVLNESVLDALWFSRPNRNAETWELRRISGMPFALLEVFDANVSEADREDALRNVEKRMAQALTKPGRDIPLEK